MHTSKPPLSTNMRPEWYRVDLVITANLSTGLALLLSLTNMASSIFVIRLRQRCDKISTNGAEYFGDTIMRTYLLPDECQKSLKIENITQADKVFLLAIIALAIAVINLALAFSVFGVVNYADYPPRSAAIFYAYAGSSIILFTFDVVIGAIFWTDYCIITEQLYETSSGDPNNYVYDMIRLGAQMISIIALKGYIGHAINLLLLGTLIARVIKRQLKLQEKSRKRLSVLNAFGHSTNGFGDNLEIRPRPLALRESSNIFDVSNFERMPVDEPWPSATPHHIETFMPHPKSGPSNPAYYGDQRRRSIRRSMKGRSQPEPHMQRTQPWRHSSGAGMGTQPFSYLEDPSSRQALPVPVTTTSASEPQWRREVRSLAPPVPDPDYSPPPRRLKSALKPSP